MNIFELFGTISIDNARANRAIDETMGHARSASNVFAKIGSVAVKAGKIAAVGIGAAATAIGKLTKDAVAAYADYEQLVGGVETLFEASSNTVLAYANNAYKTAGMSANQYMDTVTAFSASLLQSLGGDTAKAAEYADLAITDMADNANKMGTSIGDIENAYKGFSKFNFAMLDNLRIGYGGTKSEMQRLLKDAEKIQKAHGKTVKYSINSYADMVEAIHVVQEEMGITGTTAEEAGTTIQGSVGMMKAAWTNFLTGMADSNQDFKALTTNLVQSIITVANNLVPRLIETVPRLVEGIAEIGTQLATYLPDIVSSLLPALISGAVTLVSGLVKQIPALLSAVGTAISTAWTDSVWPAIQGLFKAVFGVDLPDWKTILANISDGWNNVIWPEVQNCFKTEFNVDLPDWETIKTNATTALGSISSTITTNLQPVLNQLKSAFDTVVTAITNFIGWLTSGEDSATAFKTVVLGTAVAVGVFALAMGIKSLIDGVTTAISAAKTAFALFNATLLANPIVLIIAAIAGLVASLVYLYNKNETVREAIDTAWNAIKTVFETVCSAIKGFIQGVIDLWESWQPTIKKLKAEISTGFETIKDTTQKFVADPVGTINNAASVSPATFRKAIGTLFSAPEPAKPNAAGAVFSEPTIFDTRLGRQMVGEAGPEAVAPIDVLQGYVKAAVAEANGNKDSEVAALKEVVQDLVSALPDMMVSAFATMRFDVNNREFARLVKAVN